MENKTIKFVEGILCWWENHRRDFPWRHTKNPYKILITEILLRRTTATHVNGIYGKFFQKYPTVHKLASAKPKELEDLIRPIGLANQRSGQLIKLAKTVVNEYNGKIPRDPKRLIELPGVGKYTCAGVNCISFGKDMAMVDSNVVKVITRYFGTKYKEPAYNDPELWNFVQEMIPTGKCKEFNLGLIDFAFSMCSSKSPKCNECAMETCCNFIK